MTLKQALHNLQKFLDDNCELNSDGCIHITDIKNTINDYANQKGIRPLNDRDKSVKELRNGLIEFYVAVMGSGMDYRIPKTIKKVEALIGKYK